MKKYTLFVFLLILILVLTGCRGKDSNVNNTVSDSSVSDDPVINERYPSFAVETVNASKGDKDVVIYISLKDNPGFLTMAMNITYDSDNMSLTTVSNCSDYSEYNFVGPKNMQSGCTASWFLPEIPENIVDGNILELHFDIKEQAESGSYPISISRPDNGGVVDQNREAIIFNNATGYIEIN